MTWVRYDDSAAIHRKVATLDDATYRLWREAIEWCSRNLTDGRIAADELAVVSLRANATRAAKLVDRGLWHDAGYICESEHCPVPGTSGFVIHDYLNYQPSRAKVKAEQEMKAERQRRWLESQRKDGTRDASHRASRKASQSSLAGQNGASPALPESDHRSWSSTTGNTPLVDNGNDQEKQHRKDASQDGLETVAPSPSPPRREAGTWNVPEKRPAAAGDGLATGRGNAKPCPTCGNKLDSAYHRNTCQATLSA